MRIGAFYAVNYVTDWNTCEECSSYATLLNPDDSQPWRIAGGIVEGRVIAGQRNRPTKRHEDTVATGRSIHQIRRRVIAHRADQAELVHHGIAARINDGDVVAESFADPKITIVISPGCSVRI